MFAALPFVKELVGEKEKSTIGRNALQDNTCVSNTAVDRDALRGLSDDDHPQFDAMPEFDPHIEGAMWNNQGTFNISKGGR